MYLNPNYQIANLMFRYNMLAVADPNTYSIYDSYITNAKYAKLYFDYLSEHWDWNLAFIYAIANEAASGNNTSAYNHLTGKTYNSTTPQSDQLGYELDVNLKYRWNNAVTIGSGIGYYFVGDYYSYTNQAGRVNDSKNSFIAQLNALVTF